MSALLINGIPFPLARMLAQEFKINNVNISSFWATQCGVSVVEGMAFKGEEGKDRKSQSFRSQGDSDTGRDEKEGWWCPPNPQELLTSKE